MYKGKPSKGIDFFNLLLASDEFTSELGKVALASGKLEAELILFLKQNEIHRNYEKVTLGMLISIGENENLFDKNLIKALRNISQRRNYLTHNIYALFIDLVDETILEKSDLLDSDVYTYLDKVWQLKEDIFALVDIIKKNK